MKKDQCSGICGRCLGAWHLFGDKQFYLVCVIIFSISWINVCQSQNLKTSISPHQQDLLLEIPWLLNHVEDKDVVILDVRNATEYNQEHIFRAINIPVSATFDPHGGKDRVAPLAFIQDLFGKMGISTTKQVVIYDDGNYTDAARMFWVLEVYGHPNVYILKGGMPNWLSANFPLAWTAIKPDASQYIAKIRASRIATRINTQAAINDAKTIIVDVRSEKEFQGKLSMAQRFGHIPSAINKPWNLNISETGELLNLEMLASIYSDLDKSKKIIIYSNKYSKQSSLTYFNLRRLGYNVAQYDASWFEWGNDVTLPVIDLAKKTR